MRIDPAAILHSALLGMLKGSVRKNDGPPGFSAGPAPVPSAPASAPVQAPAATNSVAMLVAMAAPSPVPPRAAALRRAERGIEALGRLHRSLLAGGIEPDLLQELRSWTAEGDAEGDLGVLLREVELRILVELARAER